MRATKQLRRDLTRWSVLCILFVTLSVSSARGQSGNGGGGNDGKPRMELWVDAAQHPSADLAVFMLDGQLWWPHIAKDNGARGAAGVHSFQVRSGFYGSLDLYPIEAIDPDDGTVSLAWNIWSDDPVLINHAIRPLASPISDGSGDIQPQSYLVEVPPALELQSVTFSGMPAAVVQDDGSAYPTPHWQQSDDSDYVPSPVMYVRGDTMAVTVTFQTIPDDGGGTLYVKGDGPGNLDFGPTAVSVAGDTVTVPLTCASAFADQVEFFDPLDIVWSYGLTSSGPWREAGTSKNLLYVTLDAPVTTATAEPFTRPVYHSLIHLGCESAAGASTEEHVLSGIWQEIADREVYTVNADGSEGAQLGYYYLGIPQVASTAGLLAQHDGQCGAWVTFFLDTLRIQGLTYSNAHVWLVPREETRYERIMVRNWEWTCGSECASPYDEYLYLNLQSSPFESFSPGTVTYNWSYVEVNDQSGIAGQKSPNPYSIFRNHQVAFLNGIYYDPSYGQQGDLSHLEFSLLSGLGRGPQSDYVYEKATGLDLDHNGLAGEDKEVYVKDIVWFMNPRGVAAVSGLIVGQTKNY